MNVKCSVCLDEINFSEFTSHIDSHISGTGILKKNLKLKCLQNSASNCYNKEFSFAYFKKHFSNVHNSEVAMESNNNYEDIPLSSNINMDEMEEIIIDDINMDEVEEIIIDDINIIEEETNDFELYDNFEDDDFDNEFTLSPEVESFVQEIFSNSMQHKVVDNSINNCLKLLKCINNAVNIKAKLKKCIEELSSLNTYVKRSKIITSKRDGIIKKEVNTDKGVFPCYYFNIISRIKLLLSNNDFKRHLEFSHDIKKNVYDSYLCGEYIQKIKNDVIRKYNVADPKILYIVTYSDDYNVTSRSSIQNSNNSSVTAGYFYFLNMNEDVSSRLESIFQFYVGPSCISKYSNDEPFRTMKEYFNEINDSVINIGLEQYFIRHVLHAGDNLELKKYHNIESGFRGRDSQPCRLCKTIGSNFPLMTRECLIPQCSVGVSDPSYFVDITHDFFLGAAVYFFKIVFTKLNSRRLISVETLNETIKNINFQDHDKPNYFKDLNNIYQNSGQMKSFFTFFPVILKRSLINENDSLEFIKTLLISYENIRKIMEIINSPIIHEIDLISLEKLIEIYIKFLRDERSEDESSRKMVIKYKEHILIHYISAIKKLGNLKKFSTIRCEAAHQQGKRMIQLSNNKKDICLTLARKKQLDFSYKIGKTNYFNIQKEKLRINDHILLLNKKYHQTSRNMPSESKYFCCKVTDVFEDKIIVNKLQFVVKIGSMYAFDDSNEYLTIEDIYSWDVRKQNAFYFMENFSFLYFMKIGSFQMY
uniref:C2H2-type domain-containing protein n=1 Tax=Strongyloides papillosus TaxID=174720 RepID=A0A0N5CCE1_STREA